MAKTTPPQEKSDEKLPWYAQILKVVFSQNGIAGLFAVVLLALCVAMLWQNHETLTNTIEGSQDREERNTKAFEKLGKSFEGLEAAFKQVSTTGELTQASLETLATRAEVMESVPAQRQQHHEIETELINKLVESSLRLEKEVIGAQTAKDLEGFKKVPEAHKKQDEAHEKAAEERKKIQETVEQIKANQDKDP